MWRRFMQPSSQRLPNVRKPLSIAEWTERCDRCHGVNGNSTEADLPALAAQRQDYLEKVLNAYRSGERKNTTMAYMASQLSEGEVAGLAAHYAQQKARAVVFVLPRRHSSNRSDYRAHWSSTIARQGLR